MMTEKIRAAANYPEWSDLSEVQKEEWLNVPLALARDPESVSELVLEQADRFGLLDGFRGSPDAT